MEDIFTDLNKLISTPLSVNYNPMTEADYAISQLDDVVEYADKIASEWNGDEPGRLEDRATLAVEIMEKAQALQDLIKELEEL